MDEFDQSKAYAPQGEIFFDDGREDELVDFVTRQQEHYGSPEGTLRAIDHFGRSQKFLMNIGEDKGKIITDLIRQVKPSIMIELGGYCGYSSILFASAMRATGGKKYYSLERNPKFARNIEIMVEFAGLSDIVEVVVGPSDEGIRYLCGQGKVKTIDMMFLDHYKPAYTTDLMLCEELGLIKKGTVIAADNVIRPGNAPYLEYVRSNVEKKRLNLKQDSKADTKNFPVWSAAQYGTVETFSASVKGNPNLIYKSELVNSFEPSGLPDGVEITWCLGEEQG